MMKNRKWIKEETLESSENRKYIFGFSDQPFLSMFIFCCRRRKEYLAFYLAGNCSHVWSILISSPLI